MTPRAEGHTLIWTGDALARYATCSCGEQFGSNRDASARAIQSAHAEHVQAAPGPDREVSP